MNFDFRGMFVGGVVALITWLLSKTSSWDSVEANFLFVFFFLLVMMMLGGLIGGFSRKKKGFEEVVV